MKVHTHVFSVIIALGALGCDSSPSKERIDQATTEVRDAAFHAEVVRARTVEAGVHEEDVDYHAALALLQSAMQAGRKARVPSEVLNAARDRGKAEGKQAAAEMGKVVK
ncbi:hypothetical protein OKA05_28490 [Luteolibacter arcticus]|uniref:DUF4398 domain-containing protein n=1 Tax=Luteolibacter arcticus TaxID=1581411 RepID=A0ABT3GSL3_9BACT|nr:hypothetical protein [Luteolibacter arcticus]MCW1926524.1 hypothetical protein [Luteolibacter arcticus]